jgi:hypothetical protein
LAKGEPARVAGSLFTPAEDGKLAAGTRRADVLEDVVSHRPILPVPPGG